MSALHLIAIAFPAFLAGIAAHAMVLRADRAGRGVIGVEIKSHKGSTNV